MMIHPLVSVITVTYNSASYVRDAIEGVLSQSYPNLEYIIADDSSTDSTWNIIGSYHDSRIVSYRNEENLGEYANRNKAIELATGKYLIFIDGDDLIYPHGIENYVKFAEAYPEVPLVIQKGYVNNVIFPVVTQPGQTLSNTYFGNNAMLTSSFASNFFHTQTLKKAGKLNTQYKTGDEEVRLRIASRYPTLFIPGWLSWPRETPGQASSKLIHGIGQAEMFAYSTEILKTTSAVDESVKQDIENSLKKKLAQQVLRNFIKRRVKTNKAIFQITGLHFKELMKFLRYTAEGHDFLKEYSPANPFRTELHPVEVTE